MTVEGREVCGLRKREFELLLVLASAPERCWTQAELLEHVWGWPRPASGEARGRCVSTAISRLRQALGDGYVANEWGVGWRLLPDGGVPSA